MSESQKTSHSYRVSLALQVTEEVTVTGNSIQEAKDNAVYAMQMKYGSQAVSGSYEFLETTHVIES